MPAQQPSITFRTHRIMGATGRLRLQIDGKPVGDIGNNEELVIPIAKGNHIITSEYFWTSKALPLELIIHDNEELEITIEPSTVKKKYLFYPEPKIPLESCLSELDLRNRRLSWDFGNDIFIRKESDSCIYFDIPNHAYLHPLRFEFNPLNEELKVFANRKQSLILYESRVDWFDIYEGEKITGERAKVHSFFREDGELLGYLFRDAENWYVSSGDLDDRLAEISYQVTNESKVFIEEHYLRSLTWENTILAYKKTPRTNYLRIQNMNIPKIEQQEILTLAYLKFSLMSMLNDQ